MPRKPHPAPGCAEGGHQLDAQREQQHQGITDVARLRGQPGEGKRLDDRLGLRIDTFPNRRGAQLRGDPGEIGGELLALFGGAQHRSYAIPRCAMGTAFGRGRVGAFAGAAEQRAVFGGGDSGLQGR
jgi:hypothetical protein